MTYEEVNRKAAEFNRCLRLKKRMLALDPAVIGYQRAVARKQQVGTCTRRMNGIRRAFEDAGYAVYYDAAGKIVRVEI